MIYLIGTLIYFNVVKCSVYYYNYMVIHVVVSFNSGNILKCFQEQKADCSREAYS